jgi:hypothetical protein
MKVGDALIDQGVDMPHAALHEADTQRVAIVRGARAIGRRTREGRRPCIGRRGEIRRHLEPLGENLRGRAFRDIGDRLLDIVEACVIELARNDVEAKDEARIGRGDVEGEDQADRGLDTLDHIECKDQMLRTEVTGRLEDIEAEEEARTATFPAGRRPSDLGPRPVRRAPCIMDDRE